MMKEKKGSGRKPDGTDEHYDDVKMKKIYPNAKGVKKEKTEEKDAGSKAAES